jgi:hypothetical protein
MKKFISLFLLLTLIVCCSQEKEKRITITNSTGISLNDVFLSFEIEDSLKSYSLSDGEKEIPSQLISSGEKKEICFVVNLKPDESISLLLKSNNHFEEKNFKSGTYAELSMKPGNIFIDGKFCGDSFVNVTKIKVPEIHTDHDALFRYEGPGWESELIGYRFYLDWRNANDIFGKKIKGLVLSNVGVHDTIAKDDSYHHMQEWGMDVFNVGSSLGIGSIGMWFENKVNMVSKTDSIYCEITENGPVRSSVKTTYFGWQVGEKKYDLVSTLSIASGSRLTKCELNISNDPENIVTGFAKFEGTDFIRNNGKSIWAYMALYGNQTLVGPEDKLGIAVFYRRNNFIEMLEDKLNYVVKLRTENGNVDYYFCAAWEQEPDGIKSLNEFIKYLDDTIELLDNPPTVKIE